MMIEIQDIDYSKDVVHNILENNDWYILILNPGFPQNLQKCDSDGEILHRNNIQHDNLADPDII